MNKKDLNKLTKNKLVKQLSDNEDSMVNLRFQKRMQQLENPQSVRYVKREIAQIKTVLKSLLRKKFFPDLSIEENWPFFIRNPMPASPKVPETKISEPSLAVVFLWNFSETIPKIVIDIKIFFELAKSPPNSFKLNF